MSINTSRVDCAMIREILNRLLKEVITIDEDPRITHPSANDHTDYTLPSGSIRINRDRVEWYCTLIDHLIHQERLEAVGSEINDLLDNLITKDSYTRNVLEHRAIYYRRELQDTIEKQGALERGWRCGDF